MNIYLRFLKYMRPYWPSLLIATVCMTVFAATNGILAYLMGPAVNILFSGDKGAAPNFLPLEFPAISPGGMGFFVPLAIIVVAFIKGASSYGNTYYMGYVGQMMISDIRKNLYDRILKLPLNFFTSHPTGSSRWLPVLSFRWPCIPR